MSVRRQICDEAIFLSRMPRRSRSENNQMIIRHLLEEAYGGGHLPREFWVEVEKEYGKDLPGWEDKCFQKQ